MKAIETKVLGQTNFFPTRIKAFDCDGNSVIASVHDPRMPNTGVAQIEPHRYVANKLKQKMGWKHRGKLVGGYTSRGYVFVFAK
jgi:hypothetical protein